ncbi:MAG: hypothetical protein A2579_13755 [Lysobacterales bacterium RIFOXYD1_FULL_69_11]|nr:MAG: hypothetical protein A2190_11085 [Xanthomonadales bacterium RIFOXYA1_FULL_69_10]OHE87016.1 MAG: hypothetical protein A2579_13755 [Xanthomonadales bacterium RIFOXYD1_FULL_69_11]
MGNRTARPPVLAWMMPVLVVGLLAGGCTWRIVESGRAATLPGIAIVILGAVLPVAIAFAAVLLASRKRGGGRD